MDNEKLEAKITECLPEELRRRVVVGTGVSLGHGLAEHLRAEQHKMVSLHELTNNPIYTHPFGKFFGQSNPHKRK